MISLMISQAAPHGDLIFRPGPCTMNSVTALLVLKYAPCSPGWLRTTFSQYFRKTLGGLCKTPLTNSFRVQDQLAIVPSPVRNPRRVRGVPFVSCSHSDCHLHSENPFKRVVSAGSFTKDYCIARGSWDSAREGCEMPLLIYYFQDIFGVECKLQDRYIWCLAEPRTKKVGDEMILKVRGLALDIYSGFLILTRLSIVNYLPHFDEDDHRGVGQNYLTGFMVVRDPNTSAADDYLNRSREVQKVCMSGLGYITFYGLHG